MKRRNFIKNTLYSSAALASTSILTNSCSNDKLKKITILHTNDVHSHIDPFDKDNDKFAFKEVFLEELPSLKKLEKKTQTLYY
jgi:5'-nucleotidase